MEVRIHGGGCCGIRHILRFGQLRELTYTSFLELQAKVSGVPKGRAIEAVLTDRQAKIWGPALAHIGFRPVFRFRNSNSGNVCNVFYYHNNPLPHENLPFSLDPARIPKEPKPIEGLPAIGQQVLIDSPKAFAHGRTGTVRGLVDFSYGKRAYVYIPYYGTCWYFSIKSLRTA